MAFEDFLKIPCKIIRKKTEFSGGSAIEKEVVIAEELCRKTSPNQRDFQLVQHQQINKQIWKIYLLKNSVIEENDLIEIDGIRYTPIYRYWVTGKETLHHYKLLALAVV